jgi:hypothetical protein
LRCLTASANTERLLSTYLNDHLAGAMLGVEMARRVRSSNEGDPVFAEPLARICGEIEADRQSLERAMEQLGVGRRQLKPAAAWAAEKLGRLKPNGQLRGYSPLSRLLELEALCIGIAGKEQLWKSLSQAHGASPGELDFDRLAERAARQRDSVEELHLEAARRAFG